MSDLDKWILEEMSAVEDKLNVPTPTTSDDRFVKSLYASDSLLICDRHLSGKINYT